MKAKEKKDIRKSKRRKERGAIKEAVYAAIGIGVLLGGSVLFTPNFPIVIGMLLKLVEELKGKKIPMEKVKRVVKEMEAKKIISILEKDGDIYITLQDKKNIDVVKYSLKTLLKRKIGDKWDGRWFLVAFDIPEKERIKRDYLHRFLNQIGFVQYQKSIYAFPFECEKEVNYLKKMLESGKYLQYIVAESIENEDKLLKSF